MEPLFFLAAKVECGALIKVSHMWLASYGAAGRRFAAGAFTVRAVCEHQKTEIC
jgi:hypothetical protein